MRILLVGGAGFIGHHLASELWLHNHEVYALDNFSVNNLIHHLGNTHYTKYLTNRYDRLNNACQHIYKSDARDYHMVSAAVEDCKPDAIVHLAAVAHANVSNKNPYSTFDHSLRTLENSLDAARALGTKQFIYFSSSMIYGDFTGGEVTEESIVKPKGIYGALKLSGEMMVKSYSEVFNLPYTIIRPSALYGPRCVSGRVLQVWIEKFEQGQTAEVQGATDKLDFTYIWDLIEGVRLSIGNPSAMNETFNITYGESRSLDEALIILKKYYPKCSVTKTLRDKTMPRRGTLNVDKARKLLGYNPQFNLEKGLDSYVRWYGKQFNR